MTTRSGGASRSRSKGSCGDRLWLDIAAALRRIGATESAPVCMTAKVMRRVRAEALTDRPTQNPARHVCPFAWLERTDAEEIDGTRGDPPGGAGTAPEPPAPARQQGLPARRSRARREALRLGRLVATAGRHYSFLVEHGLLDEARRTRTQMLGLLRDAASRWRTHGGSGPPDPHCNA